MSVQTRKRIALKTLSLLLCLTFVVSVFSATALAAGPGTPTMFIESDPYGGTNFTVGFNIWYGEGATSWKVYEDGKVIFSEALNSALKASYQVKDKSYGVYKYKVEVSNAGGTVVSSDKYQVVGGASKIIVQGGDVGSQAFQITVNPGTTSYQLVHIDKPSATFTVETNNDSVAKFSIVNGSILQVNALKSGRTSVKVKETTSGESRLVGVRVKTADGKLPGMPEYLAMGTVMTDTPNDKEFFSDYQAGDKNKRMDIRYIYINGEPDAWDRGVDGWQKWGGNLKGDRAIQYIRNSRKMGMIPFFVYYTICGANESYYQDKANIESPTYLKYYFKDLKFFCDVVAKEAGDDMVGMVLEPDFLGYMMQNSGGSNPVAADKLFANTKLVYETAYGGAEAAGILDSKVDKDPVTGQPFADNIQGLVRCINYIVTKYCPNPYFGWQINLWSNPTGAPAKGLMHMTDDSGITTGRELIRTRARETANYYVNAGIMASGANFFSIDKYGQDATATEPSSANDPASSRWFFNADHWNNYLCYANEIHNTTKLPAILWQMPVGHIERSQELDPYHGGLFTALDNTTAYEDSSASYFFGDTFKPGVGNRWNFFKTNLGNDPLVTNNGSDTVTWGSHFKDAKEAGVVATLFGAGVGKATHGNCNDTTSSKVPDDDMWFVTKVQGYFKNPVMLDSQTPTTYKMSGYICPDFAFGTDVAGIIKSGFTVAYGGKSAVTDTNGYFEINGLNVSTTPSDVKISKVNYLTRSISGVSINGNISISSQASPLEIWAGDLVKDDVINMADVMEMVKSYNAISTDPNYVEGYDINKDKAINMADVMILVRHFNKTSNDYQIIVG